MVTGVIRATGNGRRDRKTGKRIPISPDLSPGIRVMFGYYMGDHLFNECGKAKLRVLGEAQLIGIPSDDKDWSKIQPLNDRILIRLDSPKDQTEGGIDIPDVAKERPRTGIVIAVGEGKEEEDGSVVPVSVGPGDHVLIHHLGGIEVKIGDADHIIVSGPSVHCVIEN